MGIYATTTSLSVLLPGFLRDNTTTTDAEGVKHFDKHIDRAEGVVNGYCGQRYSLPFVTVPPLVRAITEDIAVYFTIRGTLNQDGKVRNVYLDDYKLAMNTLQKIADGELALFDTSGTAVDALSSHRFLSSTQNYDPIFGNDDAKSWQRDADEIADTEARRSAQ